MNGYREGVSLDSGKGVYVGGEVDTAGKPIYTASYKGLEFKVSQYIFVPNWYYMAIKGAMTKDEAMATLVLATEAHYKEEAYAVLLEDVKEHDGISYIEYKGFTVYIVSEEFGTYGSLLYVISEGKEHTIYSGCYSSNDYGEWLDKLYERAEFSPKTFNKDSHTVPKEVLEQNRDKYMKFRVRWALDKLERIIAHIGRGGM